MNTDTRQPRIHRAPAKQESAADATRAHLSIPAGASLHVSSRDRDVALFYDKAGRWFVQCEGVTAPLDSNQIDAYAQLVADTSALMLKPAATRRFLALLPGAFIFGLAP